MTTDPVVLTFTLPSGMTEQAKRFCVFLRNAGRRHGLDLVFVFTDAQNFSCRLVKDDLDRLTRFVQELTLNYGAYYYLCGVPNRREVARFIAKPVMLALMESCFDFTVPALITRHLIDGDSETLIASSFSSDMQDEFEIMFHRFKLGMLTPWEFVRDLDDLLTAFMLIYLEHKTGSKSPEFGTLVSLCRQKQILRDRQVARTFNRVHELRTKGLHRMEWAVPEQEANEIAGRAGVDQFLGCIRGVEPGRAGFAQRGALRPADDGFDLARVEGLGDGRDQGVSINMVHI